MSRPRRGFSAAEVDAAVLADQERRHRERLADPSWQMVDDEWTTIFGGGRWAQTPTVETEETIR